MKFKFSSVVLFLVLVFFVTTAEMCSGETVTQDEKDREVVDRQQSQYALVQPIPFFTWSLPRHLLIQLYELVTNDITSTYTVFSSNGTGETYFECPSMGYAIPADTSLTNPEQISATRFWYSTSSDYIGGAIGQAEPNGIFASQNTDGTWVFCVHPTESIVPVYSEWKVTTFPAPVVWDETLNRYVWASPEEAPGITINTTKPTNVRVMPQSSGE